MPDTLHEVRRELTEHELEKLSSKLNGWLKERNDKDVDEFNHSIGRHKTRLASLKTVLLGAANTLQAELNALDIREDRDTGEVYEQIREFDQAIVWLERVWEYFAAKFAQRDDKKDLGPFLEAADELVWSCYRQVWARLEVRLQKKQGPAPLAYLAPEYSPAAWQSDKPAPAELRPTADVTGLKEWLRSLPVPVVSLPPWCIDSPWWLIFVAHEVGHHLLHDMGILFGLQKRVELLARSRNLMQGEIDHWKMWTEEIFADLYSVMMLGDWALRGLREVEWYGDAAMIQWRREYPPPAVRMDLMAVTAEKLKLGGSGALGDLSLEIYRHKTPQVERDFSMVTAMVDLLLEPLTPELGKLERLCNLEELRSKIAGGEISGWALKLRGNPGTPEASLIQPRLAIMGSLCAWDQIVTDTALSPAERRRQLDVLAANTRLVLKSSGTTDERAGSVEDVRLKQQGVELAGLLRKASRPAENIIAPGGGENAVQD
ncbi:MAG: hypothetical protein ACM3PY_18465 [Omnitrophica WOR_2 bacterium]